MATHNAGKLKEFRDILGPRGIEVFGAKDYELPEPVETEDTCEGNARLKARAACLATGLPALADDSGIEVQALNGKPGVYTADWAETPQGRDFDMAMAKTHSLLIEAEAPEPWTARFCSTLVLCHSDGSDQVFEGTIDGHFIWPPRGRSGHGYDPIFVPIGYDKTFAEMTWVQKNATSHRAKAIDSLLAALF